MQIETIRQRLRALGAKPLHEQRVLRDWIQAQPHDQGRRRAEDFLPLPGRWHEGVKKPADGGRSNYNVGFYGQAPFTTQRNG